MYPKEISISAVFRELGTTYYYLEKQTIGEFVFDDFWSELINDQTMQKIKISDCFLK